MSEPKQTDPAVLLVESFQKAVFSYSDEEVDRASTHIRPELCLAATNLLLTGACKYYSWDIEHEVTIFDGRELYLVQARNVQREEYFCGAGSTPQEAAMFAIALSLYVKTGKS
jgi:hypothetical protein